MTKKSSFERSRAMSKRVWKHWLPTTWIPLRPHCVIEYPNVVDCWRPSRSTTKLDYGQLIRNISDSAWSNTHFEYLQLVISKWKPFLGNPRPVLTFPENGEKRQQIFIFESFEYFTGTILPFQHFFTITKASQNCDIRFCFFFITFGGIIFSRGAKLFLTLETKSEVCLTICL